VRAPVIGLLAVAVALAVAPPQASAATTLGETFPTTTIGCTDKTLLQTRSSGPAYEVPSAGVLTSWTHQGNATASQLKFKVGRNAGSGMYTIVGESGLQTATPNTLNTYPVTIPVQAGDLIGMYMSTGDSCARQPPGEWAYETTIGDIAPGAPTPFTSSTTVQFNLSATLEPDCDGDGLGDESQDPDASSCPPGPQATITKAPKDRVKAKRKRKRVRFAFAANEPATFECSLDGEDFAVCTSPFRAKVKRGKHTFEVRAIDAGGNAGVADADRWRVVKRKPKE